MPKFAVEFEEVAGNWGAQIGWATVDVHGVIRGLQIRRIAVFRIDAGEPTFGMPLLQGEHPGSRYTGITFTTEVHRQRFLRDLDAALRAARPDLFGREPQS